MSEESPVSAVLRSLDVDPDAPLVSEPGPLSMKPRAPVQPLSPEERAAREARDLAATRRYHERWRRRR